MGDPAIIWTAIGAIFTALSFFLALRVDWTKITGRKTKHTLRKGNNKEDPATFVAVSISREEQYQIAVNWARTGREESLTRFDLSKTDLRIINLAGVNLSVANLSKANLRRTDLSKANLSEADLRKADLQEANLLEADLRGANLGEADLRGANLGEADLRGANLGEANSNAATGCVLLLIIVYMVGVVMDWINFNWLILISICPGGVFIFFAMNLIITGSTKDGADLRGANLSQADLRGTDLYGAKLEGVILREANYNDDTKWPSKFNPTLKGARKY